MAQNSQRYVAQAAGSITVVIMSGSRSASGTASSAGQDGHMFEGFALRWIDVDDDVRLAGPHRG